MSMVDIIAAYKVRGLYVRSRKKMAFKESLF